MSDALNKVYEAIDEDHGHESAHTRRKVVAGAAGAIGSLGLMGLPDALAAKHKKHKKAHVGHNTPKNILAVAATAEVLATIVNTLAPTKVPGGFDAVTTRNLQAAAREELVHFNVLTKALGAKPLTRTIYVPNVVFSSPQKLLNTVIIGDQIFINAYLIGTTAFGNAGSGKLARAAAEFMGVEAVHRAVARQSLGLLGNDRAFIKYNGTEVAPGNPDDGTRGFTDILQAVVQLEKNGFGFGKPNPNMASSEQTAYNLSDVIPMTPNPSDVNTRLPT